MSVSCADFQECIVAKLIRLGLIDPETAETEDVGVVLSAAGDAIDALEWRLRGLHDFMRDAVEAGVLNREEVEALDDMQEAAKIIAAADGLTLRALPAPKS